MTNVLITGGAGFIGSHIAARWLREGAMIRIVDNFRSGHRSNLEAIGAGIEFLEGTIEDSSLMDQACEGIDIVHHCAALVSVPESVAKPVETESINTGGVINLLEASRKAGVKRVVFSSTSAVYGLAERPAHRESDPPAPISPYAVTKLAGEYWMRMYREIHGLETVSLRYFNVYGPRQDPKSPYAAAIAIFSDRAKANGPITIFGDGGATRDFIYIDDVVEANLLAAKSEPLPEPVINVARTESISVKELAEKIVKLTGSASPIQHAEERPGDVRHSKGDSEKIRALGWNPKVGLEEGLKKTAESVS